MILCVALNAALDRTVVIDALRLGNVNRSVDSIVQGGGKSCNVARVLHTLGVRSTIIGCAGGFSGKWIENLLEHEGLSAKMVRISGESRTCTTLVDISRNQVTDVYETGSTISSSELVQFEKLFKLQLANCSWLVLSGSLPPGVPIDYYAYLTRLGHQEFKSVLLDASGESLRSGMTAKPDLVKPNLEELAQLTGMDIQSTATAQKAALQLTKIFGTKVVVTLGSEGAILAVDKKLWIAHSPSIQSLCATGSGDALAAGFLSSLLKGEEIHKALCSGVAAGAANALTLGAGRMLKRDYDDLLSKTTCSMVDGNDYVIASSDKDRLRDSG